MQKITVFTGVMLLLGGCSLSNSSDFEVTKLDATTLIILSELTGILNGFIKFDWNIPNDIKISMARMLKDVYSREESEPYQKWIKEWAQGTWFPRQIRVRWRADPIR
jgi:hypothetical protein